MKKAGLILLFITMLLPAMGQDPLAELPWFPSRDTNHVRVRRAYSVDSLTGKRQLLYTEHFDRHGYRADSAYHNVYDAQGRLTMQETYTWVSTSANPMPRRKIIERWTVEYAPDGAVQHIRQESDTYGYSGVTDYYLLSRKVHPRFGLTDYVFLVNNSDYGWTDTLGYHREYDSLGRLLRDWCEEEERDYGDYRFYYDASGRIRSRRVLYYEAWDTADYHYDSQGVLTSQTGKLYDLDEEADDTITFRPDGTRFERRVHWINYEDPSDTSDLYFRFDEHDVLIYQKNSAGIVEYEIEYWE